MVFLRPVSYLRNAIASDQVQRKDRKAQPDNYGDAVCNAIMHLDKGHWLAKQAIERFSESYDGMVWASGGPTLVIEPTALINGLIN